MMIIINNKNNNNKQLVSKMTYKHSKIGQTDLIIVYHQSS